MKIFVFLPMSVKNYVRVQILKRRVGLPRELLVEPGDCVIQVGMWRPANALRLSKALGPNGSGIIVEATKTAADEINDLYVENGINNVSIVNSAAWKENKILEFDVAETPAGSQASEVEFKTPEQLRGGVEHIQAIRVDDLRDKYKLQHINYVEITVNGAELEVLEGMPEIFKTVDRLFVAGMMRDDKGIPANVKVQKYLEKKGFKSIISHKGAVIDEEWGAADGHVFAWR